jgi:excisionase family DNA binding protein
MAKGKDILTIGEAAKICKAASRTVSRWFDAGLIKGWRLPLSTDRRVTRTELIRFMKEHEIPYEEDDKL